MITQLTEAAETVLKRRYYLKDEEGNCIEDWEGLCRRVAKFIATAESDPDRRKELEDSYFTGIYNLDWMPNTPALTNAGTEVGMLSACIVLGVEDSITGIFDTMRDAALCHKEGSGTGFSFSDIRPANSKVKSTNGIASGPLSFIKIYNEATEAIKQGGKRRGANLATLSVDHPDIEEFIDAKEDLTQFNNFNFSVGITDAFMEKVKSGEEKETAIFNKIVDRAWRTGEPGCLFLDTINKNSPVIHLGEIKSSNPCGEIPLLPGESCNLASINLANHLTPFENTDILIVDWQKLEKTVETCVYFLNGVIDKNKYPIKYVEEMTKKTRKIGLGIMGLHDALIRMELPYASEKGRSESAQIMSFIEAKALRVSEEIALMQGPFPGYDSEECSYAPRRNATVTSIQPTGSTSMICDCSSGCEPIFSYAMVKNVMGGTHLLMVNPFFEELARKNGFYSEELMKKVSETGSVIHPEIPKYWQEILRTAGDISAEDHVKMLCALQNNGVQNAISKCLAAGTIVHTNKGLIKIEDFSDNLEPDTFCEISDEFTTGGSKIVSHYYGGMKHCTTVKFNNGSDLTGATESHKVFTPKGWKLLSELVVGDIVLGKLQEHHAEGGLELHSLGDFKSNSNVVTVPSRMSQELAEFLGMMCADGVLVEPTGHVALVKNDDRVLDRFRELAVKLFSQEPKLSVDKRNGVKTIFITSRVLVRWLRILISSGAYNKHAPYQVLRGSADEKLAFIRGCCLDGYKVAGGLTVYMGMSQQLAYELAEICRSFGLPLVRQVSKKVIYNGKLRGIAHGVTISNELLEKITPLELHKDSDKYVNYLVYPGINFKDYPKVPTSNSLYSTIRTLRKRNPEVVMANTADNLGLDKSLHAFKVTGVHAAGELPVFDIEVEGSHEYVVNGVISHNTINMPECAVREDVAKAYMMAWEGGAKGLTIYRQNSRANQVLNTVGNLEKQTATVNTSGPVKADLPDTLRARRYKVKLDEDESLYIIICFDDDGKPMEVFSKFPFSGRHEYREKSTLYTTACRLISLGLRYGIPVEEIIKQLDKSSGSMVDLPAQLTKLLKMFLSETDKPYSVPCPECGEGVISFKEGCQMCESCGYSKCS